MKRWIHASNEPEKVIDFGNGHLKDQIVTYKGVKMTRREADDIDHAKNELDYFSYKAGMGHELSPQEQEDKVKYENQLRRYRDKYGISVSWYLPNGK